MAVLQASAFPKAKPLGQIPKTTTPLQLMGIEVQATLQPPMSEICLREEIRDVDPRSQFSDVAAAEEVVGNHPWICNLRTNAEAKIWSGIIDWRRIRCHS